MILFKCIYIRFQLTLSKSYLLAFQFKFAHDISILICGYDFNEICSQMHN